MSRKDTDFPIFLFHEGNNCEAYKLFSPRKAVVKGKEGWLFRVWAPHARAVSVVGDFNGWNRDADPMKLLENTDGIWEAFVPGLKVYDVYKFCVTQADGRQVLKADPYALHSETAPATGSKLYESTYKWTDFKWMNARADSDPYSAPMNIYEVHLGSWRRHEDGTYLTYRELADTLGPYLAEMSALGYITDSSDGYFRPTEAITRAEIVTILDNMIEVLIQSNVVYSQDVEGTVMLSKKRLDAIAGFEKVMNGEALPEGQDSVPLPESNQKSEDQ